MDKKDENKNKEINGKIYEAGYHIISAVSVENLQAEVDKIKNFLAKEGTVLISEEFPKMIDLAYPMSKAIGGSNRKFDTAYFGWIKVDVGDASVAKIKKFFDENENILRFLIINTVNENTIFSSKIKENQAKEEVKRGLENKEKEIKSPVSEEDLDKTINKLIAE